MNEPDRREAKSMRETRTHAKTICEHNYLLTVIANAIKSEARERGVCAELDFFLGDFEE